MHLNRVKAHQENDWDSDYCRHSSYLFKLDNDFVIYRAETSNGNILFLQLGLKISSVILTSVIEWDIYGGYVIKSLRRNFISKGHSPASCHFNDLRRTGAKLLIVKRAIIY